MKVHQRPIILTGRDPDTTLWLNGRMGRFPQNHSTSSQQIVLLSVIYAKDKNLLNTQGWEHFDPIAKRQKNLFHATNQAKIWSFTYAPKFRYGFKVPKDYAHGIILDNKSYNTKWQDITELEMKWLSDIQWPMPTWKGTRRIQENQSSSYLWHEACWEA